mgnify:FL=1
MNTNTTVANVSDLFLIASRQKFKFNSTKGLLTVEDLWDLPLQSQTGKASLDEIARELHNKLKEDTEISFVTPKSSDTTVQQKFDIVKFIIDTRIAEREAAVNERARADRRAKLMEVIERKENDNLNNMNIEDLKKLLQDM